MTAPRTAADMVLKRFPEHGHVIGRLYRADEDFRELCDHFSECREVLVILRTSTPSDPLRIDEYETLTNELEQEIRQTVEAWPDTRLSAADNQHKGEGNG